MIGMKIEYRAEGDYLIPNLTLPEEAKVHIGKYGMLRRKYLKEHKRGLYSSLILSGKLTQHLLQIDQESRGQIELSMLTLTQTNPPPCKTTDQLGWVRHMNNLKHLAEEQVFKELIYN